VAAATLAVGLAACGSSGGAGSASTPASGSSGSGSSSSGSGTSSSGSSTSGSSGSASSAGGKDITFYLSGDVNIRDLWQKTIIPGFTKANPGYSVKINFSEHGVNDTTTLTKLGAAVKQNKSPGMDLIEAGFATSAAEAKLVEPISEKQVPNLKNVDPSLLKAITNRGVPYRGSSVVLAYDSSKISNPPKTLDELISWIKANPGKFTYNSPNSGGSGFSFVQTVLDANMSSDITEKMYYDDNYATSLEKNWDKGFEVLKGLKSSVYQGVYPNGNQAVLDLLGSGQIEMAPVWSDMALSSLASGALPKTIKLAQITDPGFTGSAVYLTVPTTSPNKAAVYKLMNYLLQPEVQAKIVDTISGYPGIKSDLLPSSEQNLFSGLDTSNLRPTYSAKFSNDAKQQWQNRVP
jgi:putative spermidine/putrescine transport system substrate-binding protein